jgi:hypothetical protein
LDLIALIIASVMIVAAGGLVARADWALVPKGRTGGFERLWVILPATFLLLLIVLAAREVIG